MLRSLIVSALHKEKARLLEGGVDETSAFILNLAPATGLTKQTSAWSHAPAQIAKLFTVTALPCYFQVQPAGAHCWDEIAVPCLGGNNSTRLA